MLSWLISVVGESIGECPFTSSKATHELTPQRLMTSLCREQSSVLFSGFGQRHAECGGGGGAEKLRGQGAEGWGGGGGDAAVGVAGGASAGAVHAADDAGRGGALSRRHLWCALIRILPSPAANRDSTMLLCLRSQKRVFKISELHGSEIVRSSNI